MATFGEQLRAWRLSARLSQRELAGLADLDFTYVSKLENNRIEPPAVHTIERLAEILGQKPDSLFSLANKWPQRVLLRENERLRAALEECEKVAHEIENRGLFVDIHWEKYAAMLRAAIGKAAADQEDESQ